MGKYADNGKNATSPGGKTLCISPFYHEAKNEIVRPDHFVACSRYFVQKWGPRLGGTGTLLVLYLRSLGFYNPRTGERRERVQVGREELSAAVGCSYVTLWRELQNNEALKLFVQTEQVAVRDRAGRLRQTDNTYHIAMDDPLLPEDEPLLAEIIARQESDAGRPLSRRTIVREDNPSRETPVLQNETPVKSEPVFHFVTPAEIGPVLQNETPCIDIHGILDIPKNNNNNIPPAAPAQTAVVALLCEKGVSPAVARELAGAFPEHTLQQQIEALAYREAKEPAAVLVKAIREDWALPAAYLSAQAEQESRRKRRETAEHQAAEQARQAEAQTAREQRLAACWSSLSAEEQMALDSQAEEMLRNENPFLARRLGQGKPGTVLEATLKGLRERLLLERLGLPLAQDERT